MINSFLVRLSIFIASLWMAGAAEAGPSSSNTTPLPVIDMLHTSWTAREGAPAGARGITQTPDGWIWMGGRSGLYKFDGVRFLRAAGPEAPLVSNISALGVLRDGRLWVGYYAGGVSLLEKGRMRHFPASPDGLPPTMVEAAVQDTSGRVWLGTSAGLYYLDTTWHRVEPSSGFPIERVHSIVLDRQGVMWVRSNSGLFSLAKGAARFERKMAAIGYATLVEHPDGSVWTHNSGYTDLARVTAPAHGPPLTWAGIDIGVFRFDREGHLWTSLGSGVERIEHMGTGLVRQQTGLNNGLSGNMVSALFEDREQNFWVATESGVDRFRKPRLRALPFPVYLGLAGRPIVGGPGSSAWVDHFYVAGPDAVPRSFRRNPGKVVTALYRSGDGKVWGGGAEQLWMLGETGPQPIPRPVGVPTNSLVVSMAQDAAGALWVNFGSKGLHKWSAGRWSIPEGLPKVEQSRAAALAADAHGRMWVGFVNGRIAVIKDGKARFFEQPQGLPIGAVTQILPLHGRAWIGGEDGLGYFDGKGFRAITGKDGERFTGISGLVSRHDGTLWINGSNGISSIPDRELKRALSEPGYQVRFGRLDYRDGLIGVAESYPLSSATVSDNGTLWFSTAGGVYAFDPDTLPRNRLVPPVTITALKSGSVEYAPVNGTLLPAGTDMLRIDFTALSFQAPERMAFRYRLEGVDARWRESTGDRSAHYTNLGPGHYRFRVMASNNDGLWNEVESAVAFDIAPSLTQTTWFRLLEVLAVIALLASAYFWRTRLLRKRYNENLRNVLEERERIARALHDTLLQAMQALVLKVQSTVKDFPRENQTRRRIEKVLDEADMVMAEGRAEVLGLRSHASQGGNLAEAVSTFGQSLQNLFGPAFALAVTGKERALTESARDEIYSISREGIFNAYRHARADRVDVELAYHENAFELFVRDDGVGLTHELLAAGSRDAHWGIPGMIERAARLGGVIELRNRKGKGTELALLVPAVRAYKRSVSE